MDRIVPRSWIVLACIVGLLFIVACRSRPEATTSRGEAPGEAVPAAPSRQVTSADVSQAGAHGAESDAHPPAPTADVAADEIWFAYYLGDAKIGHAVTRSYHLHDPSLGEVVRTEMEQEISLLRAGDRVTQKLRLISKERPSGEVLELKSTISDGAHDVITEARHEGNELHIVFRSPGSSSFQSIPWEATYRGFFGDQQVLREHPLQPGEKCSFVSFLPVLNVVGETRLHAVGYEDVDTPFGRERLLRVEQVVVAGKLELTSTLWCDAHGAIRKYHMPQGGMTAHRTVRDLALAENHDVDLYAAINVPVRHPLPDPHRTRLALYRAELRGMGDPLRIFPSDQSQTVRSLDAHTVEIRVRAIRPHDPPTLDSSSVPPSEADLAPNGLIQCDDERIVRLMGEVAPAESDDWRWAVACESFVGHLIERKALTEAFASAAEVAESRTGDCTEHAVLLAALCRARGLPARVATGLVAYQDIYAFHMWNEVWIANRWIPLDATLARGGIGAGHIKLSVSSLEGVSPFAALAPVLEVMRGLNLEIVDYEPFSDAP